MAINYILNYILLFSFQTTLLIKADFLEVSYTKFKKNVHQTQNVHEKMM